METETKSPNTELKIRALMKHLEVERADVVEPKDDTDAFEIGVNAYLVLTEDEATDMAMACTKESLWAFNFSFLSQYVPSLSSLSGREYDSVKKAWEKMVGELCESANPLVKALVGDRLDDMLYDAFDADGRAHFINTYDDREAEVDVVDDEGKTHTFYLYRMQ